MQSITSHTLVKNEERYLWYSLNSVVQHVDRMLIWDTGSTDNTLAIIDYFKRKYKEKVSFRECGEATPERYTHFRQEMLDMIKSDWFIIVDGDEVWWDDSIKKITNTIRRHGKNIDTIVNPYYNVVGDIYHYQNQDAGKYTIDGKTGHLTIRAINRNIQGLYTSKPHGQHGYFDANDKLIQERNKKRRLFVDSPYMHFTHMIRSSSLAKDNEVVKRSIKYKYELGESFPTDFFYPEVFFRPKPDIVGCVWKTMDKNYFFRSIIQTPLRKVKRKYFTSKSGY